MDTILLKYHAEDTDYLIYDVRRNQNTPDQRMMRALCAKNFALGSEGILVGPAGEGSSMHMKLFLADGREAAATARDLEVSDQYLTDAGYRQEQSTNGGRTYMTGKIFLPENFMNKRYAVA